MRYVFLAVLLTAVSVSYGQDAVTVSGTSENDVAVTELPPFKFYDFSNGASGTSMKLGDFSFHNNSRNQSSTSLSLGKLDFMSGDVNGSSMQIGDFEFYHFDDGSSATRTTIGNFDFIDYSLPFNQETSFNNTSAPTNELKLQLILDDRPVSTYPSITTQGDVYDYQYYETPTFELNQFNQESEPAPLFELQDGSDYPIWDGTSSFDTQSNEDDSESQNSQWLEWPENDN